MGMGRLRTGTLVLVLVAILFRLEGDPEGSVVSQSVLLTADHRELFRRVCHPDTVEVWFRWVSRLRAADHKPVKIGKLYQVVSTLPVLGDYAMLFRVAQYEPNKCLVLESDTWLRPKFEVDLEPVIGGRTRLTFRLAFRRTSALFQYTLGSLLQRFAHYYMQKAQMLLSDL